MKLRVISNNVTAVVQLKETNTAAAVYAALPLESTARRWGEEVYFEIPVEQELEDGHEVLAIGDVGYWPPGRSLCIFFGPTPASRGSEVRAASPVNVLGSITGDAKIFADVKDGDNIRVEAAD